jgi:acetyltransferase-like isoleucine patch superfamily enzyme
MPIEQVREGTVLELQSEPLGRFVVEGEGCRIRVGRNVRLEANIKVLPQARGATLEIGDDCTLIGVIRFVRGEGGVIRIGAGTTFNGVGLSLHERGRIEIGADCMFSADIHMDASDMHPIYDRASGERLNPAQSIWIGDHVWLGHRVLVMKGARIGAGSIVGAGSMVAGELGENVLAVGAPARVVRTNVEWARDFERPQAAGALASNYGS